MSRCVARAARADAEVEGDSGSGALRIADAAARVGLSPATLRLWERLGLIKPARTPSGYRVYGPAEIERLRRIQSFRLVERLSPAAIARLFRDEDAEVRDAGDRWAPGLGDRLRVRRRRAGLSLREVARRTGISVSFLSAVERGVSGPSVPTLFKLTELYGVRVHDLLDNRRTSGRLVRATDRPVLPVTGSGIRLEQPASGSNRMVPQVYVVEPGAGSGGAYDHRGEELIFMLKGSFEVWLDEQEHYELAPGDCLYFPSTIQHRWRNPGKQVAELLWVWTPSDDRVESTSGGLEAAHAAPGQG